MRFFAISHLNVNKLCAFRIQFLVINKFKIKLEINAFFHEIGFDSCPHKIIMLMQNRDRFEARAT